MRLFYCYNPKLRRYIYDNGIRWIDKGVNPKSGYPRWIFEQTDELSTILKRYKNEIVD